MPRPYVSDQLANLAAHYDQRLVGEMTVSGLSLTVTTQVVAILAAAAEWRAARLAFLALPPGSPERHAALNHLSEGDTRLNDAVQQAVRAGEPTHD